MKGPSENSDLKKKFEDFTYPVGEASWDAISAHLPAGSPKGFLAGKFSNHVVQPSPTVWAGIAAAIQPAHKKRPVAWWWYAAAASFLLFVYFGYVVYNVAEGPSQLVQEVKPEARQVEKNALSESATTTIAGDSAAVNHSHSGASPEMDEALKDANSHLAKGPGQAATTSSLAERTTQVANATNVTGHTDKQSGLAGDDGREYSPSGNDNSDINVRAASQLLSKIARRNPKFQGDHASPVMAVPPGDATQVASVASAKASTAGKHSKGTGFFDGTEASATQNLSLWAGSLMALTSAGSEDNMATYTSEGFGSGLVGPANDIVTNDFSPPVYYGINGEFKFWNRMAAGLGVGFLQMRTTSRQQLWTGGLFVHDIHDKYISIPIYLKFNFIDRSKFAAYSTAGHGFDIQVGQKISTESHQTIQSIAGNKPLIPQQGNQANLFAGLGMHFKFTKQFGIFAEASLLRYYQLSNSNFYSQQNYWPGLRFGLLLTFE